MSKFKSKAEPVSAAIDQQEPTDGCLLGRAAQGEESAFAQLYQRYAQRLFVYFERRCGHDRELAGDLRQQVFLQLLESKAFTAAKKGLVREDLSGLLFSIAANLLKNNYRSAERRQRRENDYAPWVPPPEPEPAHYPEGRQLSTALDQLSEPQRICLHLRFTKGMSIAEIAKLTGKPPGTVKSRLHYGLRQLRQLLAPK